MACGFAFLGQSTAVLVINNFAPLQYAALGFDTEVSLKGRLQGDMLGD